MINLRSTSQFRFVAIGIALGTFGIANADEVHITGTTMGQFNAQVFANQNSLLGLTYDNSLFDNTTVFGELDLGGNPNPTTNFNNLGTLTLDRVNHAYTGNTFSVQVTFTAPSTIVGGNTTTFTDIITGTVANGVGGVFIDFNNTPQTFFYSNAQATGFFTIAVNDLSIAPGQSASITAHVHGNQTPVPEASTIAGVTCGMLGLFGLIRRKK